MFILKFSDKGFTFENSRACMVSISSLYGKGLLYTSIQCILGDKIVVGMYMYIVYSVCTASFKRSIFVERMFHFVLEMSYTWHVQMYKDVCMSQYKMYIHVYTFGGGHIFYELFFNGDYAG